MTFKSESTNSSKILESRVYNLLILKREMLHKK